jgi:hypothetical protein
MMNAQGLRTTNFSGKPVGYQGVTFDGTPRVVFWGDFFEPFMYDAARQSLDWVIASCRERHLEPDNYLSEATGLLGVLITKAYEEMARTDQILRGRGYPNSFSQVHISHKVDAMKKKVADLQVALAHTGGSGRASSSEILQLRPGLWGISLDLKALWRWFKRAV